MRAHGVDVPDEVEIEVVEATPEKQYVVLPPLQTDELSEEQLAGAQGGTITLIGLITQFGALCAPAQTPVGGMPNTFGGCPTG